MKTEKAWEYTGANCKSMTLALAKRIREIRENASWRGVACEITNDKCSNQLLGMYLCRKSDEFFKKYKELDIRKHPQFVVYEDDFGNWHIKYYQKKQGNGIESLRRFRAEKISKINEIKRRKEE